MKKGTQLLEVYALEIQMYTEQKNNQKLKALYEQSLHIKSAIPHPLIMGVIRGRGPLSQGVGVSRRNGGPKHTPSPLILGVIRSRGPVLGHSSPPSLRSLEMGGSQ